MQCLDYVSDCGIAEPCVPDPVPPGASLRPLLIGNSPGLFIRCEEGAVGRTLEADLRITEVATPSTTARLSVVPQALLVTGARSLLGIRLDARGRHTLRIFALPTPDDRTVAVRVYRMNPESQTPMTAMPDTLVMEKKVILSREEKDWVPSYGETDLHAPSSDPVDSEYRVELLPESDLTTYWPLVVSVDNATNAVSVFELNLKGSGASHD